MKTLRPSEIAAYCDVHHRTVSRWIANGQLKGHKLPGRGNYRVQLADFLDFLERQNMPVPSELEEQSHDIKQKLVLVVDDEASLRSAIMRAIKPLGFALEQAEDGFRAGIKMGQLNPDLLTLDLAMPGLDGYEVLQYIKQQPQFRHVKVLVISGLDQASLSKAYEYGADAVLAKPFENVELQSLVAGLLAN